MTVSTITCIASNIVFQIIALKFQLKLSKLQAGINRADICQLHTCKRFHATDNVQFILNTNETSELYKKCSGRLKWTLEKQQFLVVCYCQTPVCAFIDHKIIKTVPRSIW